MVRMVDGFLGLVAFLLVAVVSVPAAVAQDYGIQNKGLPPYAAQPIGQDVCYSEQLACNRQCGRDKVCQSTICFEQAVACKRRQQQVQQEQLQKNSEQELRQQAQENPKTFVLPPLDVCASVGWQGEGYWEFLVTNNCPAAVEVDVTFNGGTRANVFCEGYETCKARFPKRRVGDQFNYQLRYVSE